MRTRRSLDMKLAAGALYFAALVAAGGCTASSDAPELITEASQLTPAEQDALVDQLAFDPRFVAFNELAFDIHGRASRKFAAMTPAEWTAAKAEASDIAADAHVPDANADQLASRVTALTGVPWNDLRLLQTRAIALRTAFPQLVQTGPALLGQAVYQNPVLTGILVTSGGVEEDDDAEEETVDCLNDCLDEYIAAHNRAGFDFGLDLLGCAASGNPYAAVICIALSTAEWAVEELIATNNYDNCKDGCFGIPPQGECDSDADCLSSQWCDTGTLGFGDNECEPDKSIGEVCSRDAKCSSGCCKFDFWQNPVSMTCNPASDCN